MPTQSNSTAVEGFILDTAFLDQRKIINGILIEDVSSVGTLTQNGLSYFNTPFVFKDSRNASSRDVNWAASTVASIIVDNQLFSDFDTTIDNLSNSIAAGFFKIIDRLVFKFNASTPSATIESFLNTDSDTHPIYVPGSFSISSRIVNDVVYLSSGSTTPVSAPDFVRFSIIVPSGSTTRQYDFTLFCEVSAFLAGYSSTTILDVVPAIDYATLYSASITLSNSNVFSIASQSASLLYNTTHNTFNTNLFSGIHEQIVMLVDTANNTTTVPFNLFYRGRKPTQVEARGAIRDALLASGIGNEAGWKARIPGVFITGRFYIVPFWGETVSKPDQVVFPNILSTLKYINNTKAVMASKSWTTIEEHIEVISVAFDKMIGTVVPELSGVVDVSDLASFIPDYQSYAPSDQNYTYMDANTKLFTTAINAILALDKAGTTSTTYHKTTENLLEFFVFTVDTLEFCVITKNCYTQLLGSTL